MRHFSSYGPVDCKAHFCVKRLALIEAGVQQLIGSTEEEGGHYFTIWAPRQTGKTWLMRQIQQAIGLKYPEEFAVFNFSLGALKGMPSKQSDFPEAFGRLLKIDLPTHPSVKNWDDFRLLFSKEDGLWDRPLTMR